MGVLLVFVELQVAAATVETEEAGGEVLTPIMVLTAQHHFHWHWQ